MSRFENLKSNTVQISLNDLLRVRLDEGLVEGILSADPSLQSEPILTREILTKKDLDELKTFLEKIKSKLPARLYDDCMEDFREIQDDVKWKVSKDGKVVLALEDWLAGVREKINSEFKGVRIFIGRSFIDPKELVVGGIVKDDAEMKAIKEFIEREKPPVIPAYKFEKEQAS